jgi:hypothetical protein
MDSKEHKARTVLCHVGRAPDDVQLLTPVEVDELVAIHDTLGVPHRELMDKFSEFWAGHVARLEEQKATDEIAVQSPRLTRPAAKPRPAGEAPNAEPAPVDQP